MGFLHNLLVATITVVLIEEGWWWCDGCLERERVALLELKDSINFPNGKALPSWGKHANCCDWESVTCDTTTRRVTQIDLWGSRDWELEDWQLNASLFLPFEELHSLYLTHNRIVGCFENEGFEKLSRLHNLEVLDLGRNKFNNSILSSLAGLSSLRSLYLHLNELKGMINIEGCNFFRWHDRKMSPRAKNVIISLRDSEKAFFSENQTLNIKYHIIKFENEELYDKLEPLSEKNEQLSTDNKELQDQIKLLQSNLDDLSLSQKFRTKLYVFSIVLCLLIFLLGLWYI